MYPHIRSVRYHSATQTGYSAQAQHNSVAQLVSLEFTDSTCECRRLVQFIFVGAVYHNALTNCAVLLSPRGPSLALRAIHLVPRLRRVADMCSSKVSVNCEYFTKQTQEYPDCRSPISERSHIGNLRQTLPKGSGS